MLGKGGVNPEDLSSLHDFKAHPHAGNPPAVGKCPVWYQSLDPVVKP